MSSIKEHRAYYIFFTLIQILGLVILLTAPNQKIQLTAILLMAFSYFVFAIAHHMMNHDLTAKIVVEYALFASIGLAVVMLLLR